MPGFELGSLPLWVNVALFVASGALIWTMGKRLAGHADAIAEKTGLSRAFLGAALLGGITSLPELSTTLTASALGNGPLAVNNLIGGVSMQVVVLALADSFSGREPLSAVRGPPVILLQGCLGVVMLAVTAAGVVMGEPRLPVGPWAGSVTVLGMGGFFLLHRAGATALRPAGPASPAGADRSARTLWVKTAVSGLGVFVGGVVGAQSADAIATQTGLGSGLLGFYLLSTATSLPEISTTLAAARMGLAGMAFANIFGSNVIDLTLLGLADLVYAGEPVLNSEGSFAVFGCLLGIVLTALYLVGIIERRDRAVAHWGPDSLAVVALYVAGAGALYALS
jgi:cation:H+ antiporter